MLASSFLNSANFWAGFVSSVCFAVAGIYAIIRFFHRIAKKLTMDAAVIDIDQLRDELRSDLSIVKQDLNSVVSQYRNNGGSSAKDQWDSISNRIEDLNEQVRELNDALVKHLGYHEGLNARED